MCWMDTKIDTYVRVELCRLETLIHGQANILRELLENCVKFQVIQNATTVAPHCHKGGGAPCVSIVVIVT